MIYEIITDALRSNYDPRKNLGPHVDEIIGSTNAKSADQVTNQMQNWSLNQPAAGQATTSSSPTQSLDVRSMQSTNPKGNLYPRGNKRKGRNNNRKGGNNNNNKSKNNQNNEKLGNNDGEGKKQKQKVKFPYKLCK
jgi:hypothetical protein